jgi:hypothetical protein
MEKEVFFFVCFLLAFVFPRKTKGLASFCPLSLLRFWLFAHLPLAVFLPETKKTQKEKGKTNSRPLPHPGCCSPTLSACF